MFKSPQNSPLSMQKRPVPPPCPGIQLIWHGDIHNIEPPPPPPPCRRGARKVPAFIRPADRMQPAAENWPLNVTGSLCVVRLLLCLSAACPGLGSLRLGSGPTLASMMALVGQFHPPLHCINVGSVSSQARHRYFSVPAERKMGHVVSWSEVATRSPESDPQASKSVLFCNVQGNGARECAFGDQARGCSHSHGNNNNDIMGGGIETRGERQMCRVLGARGRENEEERKRKG